MITSRRVDHFERRIRRVVIDHADDVSGARVATCRERLYLRHDLFRRQRLVYDHRLIVLDCDVISGAAQRQRCHVDGGGEDGINRYTGRVHDVALVVDDGQRAGTGGAVGGDTQVIPVACRYRHAGAGSTHRAAVSTVLLRVDEVVDGVDTQTAEAAGDGDDVVETR